ncbi:flagellar hook-basal body protein [Caldicellulosiruptoraceae bacterium PP1]
MIRGIYTSASGMILNQKVMDITANNMANVDTTGYKKDIAQIESFSKILAKRINDRTIDSPDGSIGYMSLGADVSRIYTDTSEGLLKKTDQPLELAIKGEGFFTVEKINPQTNTAERFLTRNGAFTLNQNGELVTLDGYRVLGQNGSIKLNSTSNIRIDKQGNIYQNNQLVDKLLIINIDSKESLAKVGNNLFMINGNANPVQFSGEVLQGYLEGSNVNAIQEMVNMISLLRNYESNQKAFTIQDETLQKAVNEIARK